MSDNEGKGPSDEELTERRRTVFSRFRERVADQQRRGLLAFDGGSIASSRPEGTDEPEGDSDTE